MAVGPRWRWRGRGHPLLVGPPRRPMRRTSSALCGGGQPGREERRRERDAGAVAARLGVGAGEEGAVAAGARSGGSAEWSRGRAAAAAERAAAAGSSSPARCSSCSASPSSPCSSCLGRGRTDVEAASSDGGARRAGRGLHLRLQRQRIERRRRRIGRPAAGAPFSPSPPRRAILAAERRRAERRRRRRSGGVRRRLGGRAALAAAPAASSSPPSSPLRQAMCGGHARGSRADVAGVGKMLPTKRGGGDLTRSAYDSKRTRSLVSGDDWYTNQGVWSGLGKEGALRLSKSVVSLALSDGDKMIFSSSGIAIECTMDATRFLTSASLVTALNNNKAKNHDYLKIEVRHEGKVVTGFLEEYDLHLKIAVVKIKSSLDVRDVFLYHRHRFMLYCDVVSLGRDTSGKLMAMTGKLTRDSSGSKDSEYIMFSSCKLSEVWEGGPLFNYAGDFVGMNLVPSMKKSFFLPTSLIIERLQHFQTSQERNAFLAQLKDLKTMRIGEKLIGAPNKYHLEVLGYPRPTGSGMTLVNTFEEQFGDVYRNGFWKQLGKGVRRKIRRSVVSLASFNGDTRVFACSGIFIDWDGKCGDNGCQTILTSACLVRNPEYPYVGDDMIVEGLRIEVLLPSKERTEGTLIHYNLHYNVALVSVQESCAVSHAIYKHGSVNWSSKLVAAVGLCFKSSDLMASSGKLVPWSGPFDCERLRYSTCRITKAGIGGPLVDYDGNFIGMNFFDPKVGTPFLFCDDIVDILDCFKKRPGAAIESFRFDGDGSVSPNRWPVPSPCWVHPGEVGVFGKYERELLASGRRFRYCGGRIRRLK